jgi:uncharacterized paraquat-inducible protein A
MKKEKKEYIQFACSNCNVQLKAPPESNGKKGQCPKCGYLIIIPEQRDVHSS